MDKARARKVIDEFLWALDNDDTLIAVEQHSGDLIRAMPTLEGYVRNLLQASKAFRRALEAEIDKLTGEDADFDEMLDGYRVALETFDVLVP